jgi:hypothetical protein
MSKQNKTKYSQPIGILLKKPENVFSNGCIQQVLFLKKLFQNVGFPVDFLSVEPGYTTFDLSNDVIIFTDANFDFSNYHCIVLGSLVLSGESNIPYINNLMKHNVPIINLICGNVFVLHQEEFVFNTHNIMSNYIQPYITENWVMEMYDYAIDYVKMLSNKPSKIVPYTWDADIIKAYIANNKVFQSSGARNNSQINLLLFEPNMSIHKNALIPLLICEEYYRQNKNKLHKIYAFCSDSVIQHLNPAIINHLSIFKDNKLEVYGRIIMPYIVDTIEKNNPFLNVVVSYNLLNRLNFLHLEMFHIGIPIIHNCKPFHHNGLYFQDFDLLKAVSLIEHVRTSFDKESYIQNCKTNIIDKFASSNKQRIDDYEHLLLSLGKKQADNPLNTSSFFEIKNDHHSKLFKQGEGFVVVISSDQHVNLSLIAIKNLVENEKQFNLEIIVHDSINHDKLSSFITAIINPFIKISIISSQFNNDTTSDLYKYVSHTSSFKNIHILSVEDMSVVKI